MMRKIISNIYALVTFTVGLWFIGIVCSICLNTMDWVNGARILSGIPILMLFNRRSIRLGWKEDYHPTYKIEEAGIHWKNGDSWEKASYKMRCFIDQLGDSKAKRLAIILSITGVLYFFIAPLVVEIWVKP